MNQNLVIWLTLLLFAGSVFGQDNPPQPDVTQAPLIVVEVVQRDSKILNDTYQRENFTYPYQSAVLRRALAIEDFPFISATIQPPIPFHDGVYEPTIKNLLRGVPAAWNRFVSDGGDQYDGYFATVARISFIEGFTINCVSTLTRRKVDHSLVWIRLSPCEPEWGTEEAWAMAARLDHVGFLNLEKSTFEKTPQVRVGPDSFKTRSTKKR